MTRLASLFRASVRLCAAAAFVFIAGCRCGGTPVPPKSPGWEEARSGALRQMERIRARRILHRQAARFAASEELRAELDDLIGSFPSGGAPLYDADIDPRYFYGLEAISYCGLLLLRPAEVAPEEFILPAARAEVEFEVLAMLARLAWERESEGRAALRSLHRDLELELALATGLPAASFRDFDFSTLPETDRGSSAAAPETGTVGAEPLRVARRLFDLPGIAAKSPAAAPPGEAELLIAQELALLRSLAEAELRAASDPKNSATPEARLARRLAAGRLRQLAATPVPVVRGERRSSGSDRLPR